MKKYLIPVVISGLLLAGCSSAYRTGQTPDDVYFSTSPVVPAELASSNRNDGGYESYWRNPEDDYLRMKVQRGGRWNSIDDLDYWYGYNGLCQCNANWGYNGFNSFSSPWGYNNYNYGIGYNPWGFNSFSPWGYNSFYGGGYYSSFYNPGYYYPFVITSKYPTAYSSPSRPSLRGYGNNLYGSPNSNTRRVSSSSNPQSSYRTIFSGNSNSGSSNNNGSTYERPARTFGTGSSSSGSSSGGSSRSSGGSSGGSSSGSSRGGRGG